jgi:hypothetical protein
VQAANNQPAVKMEEEDGDYHSNSSSTQLPSQHLFRNRDHRERRERHGHHGGGVDFSTVPTTPLSNCRHLMSPVRQSTDGDSSASHHYLLWSTPEWLAASGSCSGGEVGSRVASRGSVVSGGIPGSVVGGGIPGSVVSGGIPAAGVVVAGVAGGGGIPSVVDVGTGGVGVASGGGRGGRVGRGGGGRGSGGGGTRQTRQPTENAAGGTARQELEITPPLKWTLCCRPFGLFA